VKEAIPVQIVVNNCGASLDVIAFRGVPPGDLQRYNPELEVIEGSYGDWENRTDGALVGQHLAARRGLKPGDTFEAVGVRVHVSGIVQSPLSQDNNVAYVHLNFLQQSSRVGLGTVTQFNVRTDGIIPMEEVAHDIDTLFAADAEPTDTRPEKAFFAQTAQDMIEIIRFSRWIGLGAVLTVLALVSNALILVARGRVKENAILQTLGYSRIQVSLLLLWEGLILGLCGGGFGSLAAAAFFHFRRYTFGNEGLTLALEPNLTVALTGMGLAMLLGLLASLWPAYLTSRQSIISSLSQAG
jgi:putative ABC transport system permease protein